jgi:hypothetical protein
MRFDSILNAVKKSFSPRKNVDFEEQGLHFELEPLISTEEIKVLEACKSVDETQYIEALKRNTLACSIKRMTFKDPDTKGVVDIDLSKEIVDYEEEGLKKSKSKFLFMVDYLGQWPSSMVDLLFDVFSNMVRETESKIRTGAKFEIFKISEKPLAEKDTRPKVVQEDAEDTTGLTETERLNKKVEKELAEADEQLAEAAELHE